jgi:hypothetical protein
VSAGARLPDRGDSHFADSQRSPHTRLGGAGHPWFPRKRTAGAPAWSPRAISRERKLVRASARRRGEGLSVESAASKDRRPPQRFRAPSLSRCSSILAAAGALLLPLPPRSSSLIVVAAVVVVVALASAASLRQVLRRPVGLRSDLLLQVLLRVWHPHRPPKVIAAHDPVLIDLPVLRPLRSGDRWALPIPGGARCP